MRYSDLYKYWKSQKRKLGYADPSENTEENFKEWISNQIDYIW